MPFARLTLVAVFSLLIPQFVHAQPGDKGQDKAPDVYPAALFPFEERGAGVKDFGPKVTDILFAKLAADFPTFPRLCSPFLERSVRPR